MPLKLIEVKKSPRADKKLVAVFQENGKTLLRHFGQKGASDFTIHHDEVRKKRYLDRHRANEYWEDPKTAGSLAKWILWNKPTITESVSDFKRRFNL